MEEFDNLINDLRELYKEKPKKTIEEINSAIVSIKSSDIINKTLKILVVSIIYIICIALLGLTNIGISQDLVFEYYIGAIFFLVGLAIGLKLQLFGIIFLFSHGCTGLGLMVIPKIIEILKNPIMTDNPTNIMIFLTFGVLLVIVGIILTIMYNLNKKFKYSLFIILGVFLLGIAIIQLLPYIYGITL